jgi:hypothetical protein
MEHGASPHAFILPSGGVTGHQENVKERHHPFSTTKIRVYPWACESHPESPSCGYVTLSMWEDSRRAVRVAIGADLERGGDPCMWWLLTITAAVFLYLCYVLVHPERF